MIQDCPQTKEACARQQAACERLYIERNERHKSEVYAIGHNVEAALLTIKGLVGDFREDIVGHAEIEKMVADRIVIFMATNGSRDLAKGTIALPAVISLVIGIVIFVSGWFSVKYTVDSELYSIKSSIEMNKKDIDHIEKTIGSRVR